MINKIVTNIRNKHSKENWTSEKWYSYLIDNARSQPEKNEIHAVFNREH